MIIHVDMDAFYASVEERENPSLVGKPVIVGGSAAGRGVVAAANYEARKFGVHSAMATARAQRLCPQAVLIKPRIEFYAAVSQQIRGIFADYTPLIEPLSLDEAFLDVRGSAALFGSAVAIARLIQQRVRDELRLVASLGVAPNKFVAKIASDLNKPAGFVVVEQGDMQAFLDPLPISRLWGVGKVTGQNFARFGLHTIGQVRSLQLSQLQNMLGPSAEHFWRLASGQDDRAVIPDREAKSISHETTFAEDIREDETLRGWLAELVEQVARRLRRYDLKGRTIEIKIRYADFQTVTRSFTLREPTNITSELWQAALEMFDTRLANQHPPVRLLGFGVHSIVEATQPRQQDLFGEEKRGRERQIDSVADQIVARFGKQSINRGRRPSE
ncbi:DNA polymerase IV [Anatilimnocola aggregata]|uniref:DNA polymerase IV n=1 Tax=Anatilimnocola aggregata TaxID=2528021 RepID=A0A517YH06_9BACT|nr:DNA polymerase IV [Anatilimnocola aggregata]QDU29499.1 DNA polymerase IV [Anatilimnocola aggregata]